MPKQYNRIILGKSCGYVDYCKVGGFIGSDTLPNEDLSNNLPSDWREFNKQYLSIWLNLFPEKSKVAAGLACGNLWTICKGLQIGDIVLAQMAGASIM